MRLERVLTTTLGQNRPGSKGNEVVLNIFQNYRTGASPSDGLVDAGWGKVLSLCRDTVSVFYSPSRLGSLKNGGIAAVTENWVKKLKLFQHIRFTMQLVLK